MFEIFLNKQNNTMKHQFQDLSGFNLWLNNDYLSTYENMTKKGINQAKAIQDKAIPPKSSKTKEE